MGWSRVGGLDGIRVPRRSCERGGPPFYWIVLEHERVELGFNIEPSKNDDKSENSRSWRGPPFFLQPQKALARALPRSTKGGGKEGRSQKSMATPSLAVFRRDH